MTKSEFDLIAKLLKSKGPVVAGVEQVLFQKVANAQAARNVGCTPQALHRSTKRFMGLHSEIIQAFKRSTI